MLAHRNTFVRAAINANGRSDRVVIDVYTINTRKNRLLKTEYMIQKQDVKSVCNLCTNFIPLGQ